MSPPPVDAGGSLNPQSLEKKEEEVTSEEEEEKEEEEEGKEEEEEEYDEEEHEEVTWGWGVVAVGSPWRGGWGVPSPPACPLCPQETDYIMSYFDNGEDFGGDSDDNMDEAVY